ncbi:hypothetical protein [Desulfonatronovibrio magnus]|uniref:hypothetical protein n=1 Tax=Desulfonatronovibrio magnus TaxID=698827 RepID=UPI0012FA82B4|nr:hypothetical protein [Desulfonatronovibrio magnus]
MDDPYIQTTREWTRSGALYSGIETDILVQATLKSKDWTQAYFRKKQAVFSPSPREIMEQEERALRDLETEITVFVSLFSPVRDHSNLRFNDPLWSIFIVQDDENIYPIEIRPVRLPLARLKVFYPYVDQWHRNFNIRFPAPAGESVLMVMTGPLGRIELEW